MAELGSAETAKSGTLSDVMDQKKTSVTDRLQKRDEERLADMKKRKEQLEKVTAANENVDFFTDKFSQGCTEIEDGLKNCDDLSKSELTDRLDDLVVILQSLNKFVSESTMFLASFEVQKAQETLQKLQQSIQDKKEQLAPKKKFAFKSKKKVQDQQKATTHEKTTAKPVIKIEMAEKRLSDRKGESLKLGAEDINNSDVVVTRSEDCIIQLFGSPSTIHATNLKNCTFFSGPISTSLFVDGCKDCTFVIACQQARIHSTTESKFYIHVTSRAIIEDCSQLSFAPFNWSYDGLDEHYSKSGLDQNRNTWDDVDDFNWLASDAHSPNWDVIPKEKRVIKWT